MRSCCETIAWLAPSFSESAVTFSSPSHSIATMRSRSGWATAFSTSATWAARTASAEMVGAVRATEATLSYRGPRVRSKTTCAARGRAPAPPRAGDTAGAWLYTSCVDPTQHQPGSGQPPSPDRTGRSRWWPRPPVGAPAIAALYALAGLAWIAFSDRLFGVLVPDPALRQHFQTVKGTAFVLLSAVLLFAVIRRSERGNRALGAELRATVDGMADGILLVDERSVIVEANRAAVTLVGAASKDEILGPLEAWGRRFEVRSTDGAPMPYERYAVLRDVSASRHLDEMREEFLATAAHEFKTPLAVIKAYAQIMARREPAEQRALAVIQRQVDRLTRLVQQLLDSSRLRLEDGAVRAERFDLAALAAEVVERMRPAAPGHALSLDAGASVPVVADRERIERVIANLLENAIRFSPGGGPVRLRVGALDSEARVSVADDGVGIPSDRQGHVFQRYYRAHAGTPDDYGGLGLGLEVSRVVIERHGGRMWFESAPGQGSTFHFGLPLPREDA